MSTGREPGAPGITPGPEFTRRPGGPGGTGHEAVDLGEIRRSEELINQLAAREHTGGVQAAVPAAPPGHRPVAGFPGGTSPGAGADPAVAMLAALIGDVDTPPERTARPVAARPVAARPPTWRPAAGRPGVRRGAHRRRPARRAAGARSARGLAAWLRAAAAGAVVAGLAGTTSLIAASMLARLHRVTGGRAGATSRPRRYR